MRLIEMYRLHVTDVKVFSTQRCVIIIFFVAQLHVPNNHSFINIENNSRTLHMLQNNNERGPLNLIIVYPH